MSNQQWPDPIKIDDTSLPDIGTWALWYDPIMGWNKGQLIRRTGWMKLDGLYIREDDNEYRIEEYTHWLPLPPDPPAA